MKCLGGEVAIAVFVTQLANIVLLYIILFYTF